MRSKRSIKMLKNFLGYKFLILSLVLSAMGNATAIACSMDSCDNQYEIVPPKFNRARVVFIGKVVRIDRYENLKDVKFSVSKIYKGDIGGTVTVNSENAGYSSAVCGNDFREGEEYLVYAYGMVSDPGDTYSVEACGGARKLSCAAYEIAKLEIISGVK